MSDNPEFLEISDDDIKVAFKEIRTYIDISPEDFKVIYVHALNHARARSLNITVDKVMSKNVISITKELSIKEAIQLLSENEISCLPVVDKDNAVVGIVTHKDVIAATGIVKNHTLRDIVRHLTGVPTPHQNTVYAKTVEDIMSSPAIAILSGTDMKDAAHKLIEMRINSLPVVDKDNKLMGVISTKDIVNHTGGMQL